VKLRGRSAKWSEMKWGEVKWNVGK
jgi:hypothetical protein